MKAQKRNECLAAFGAFSSRVQLNEKGKELKALPTENQRKSEEENKANRTFPVAKQEQECILISVRVSFERKMVTPDQSRAVGRQRIKNVWETKIRKRNIPS
ncbi:hypothetical protein RUM43_000194 [Polyplax serrata]|uniref:Uncharacterized protein n=1 Tax=Polyplax serrata TaxID=468196 RepID=A0AAN8XN52_POLSC